VCAAQALLQEEHGDGAGGVAPGVLLDEDYRWCAFGAWHPRASSFCAHFHVLSFRSARDVLARSHRVALSEAPRLVAAMRDAGWNTGVVLWTPQHVADWSMALPSPELRCPLPPPPPPPPPRFDADEEAEAEAEAEVRAAVAQGADDVDVLASTATTWSAHAGSGGGGSSSS
jgi:hypothetical protein